MGFLKGIIVTFIVLILLAIIGFIIWYFFFGPGKSMFNTPSNGSGPIAATGSITNTGPNGLTGLNGPSGPPFVGSSYNNPMWHNSVSGVVLNGFTAGTSYDNSAPTAISCAAAIQTAAKLNSDNTVVGWAWSSDSNNPNSCRAVTTSNITNPCLQPVITPNQGFVGKTGIDYYNILYC